MHKSLQKIHTGLVLGEGPVWHAETQTLFFVDIEQKKVFSLKNDAISEIVLPGRVGCVVPVQNAGLLAAVDSSLYRLSPSAGTSERLLTCPMPNFLRFNDGKCDAQGRFWVGSMAVDQAHKGAKAGGSLYCIECGSIAAQYEGFTIPNGMAWNAEGSIFYHIDTATGGIDAYEVQEGVQLTNKRCVVRLCEKDGVPDGMCMDADGNLWVALWGGGRVVQIDPSRGALLQSIQLPEKNVSCCTFGGAAMQTLFVTTAQDEKGLGGSLWSIETTSMGTQPYYYKDV